MSAMEQENDTTKMEGAMTPEQEHAPLHSPPTSPQRPKGILKNSSQNNVNGPRLTWDEENLAATEIDKDSLMKIDEPKTPFVHHNAELDDDNEGDIPAFDLDQRNSAPSSPSASTGSAFGAAFQQMTAENTAANAQRHFAPSASPSSLHATFSPEPISGTNGSTASPLVTGSPSANRQRSMSTDRISRRASFSTTRSGSSSRSTSFSLPPDDLGRTEFKEGGLGLLRGEDDVIVDDEEALDEATLAKRQEFRKARGRHYSNEAEAMKVRCFLAMND
ncbi:hypothetical protein DL93DRAFT_143822 [Clavulina sp. PMI_390]|nr:hypothetical protein DL93DRAFT_143822 [Clavulina sp. PMI_390]